MCENLLQGMVQKVIAAFRIAESSMSSIRLKGLGVVTLDGRLVTGQWWGTTKAAKDFPGEFVARKVQ